MSTTSRCRADLALGRQGNVPVVRQYEPRDLEAVAAIHGTCFPRQRLSLEWIAANARAHPRARYFVAEVEGLTVGYVLWLEKSGFRDAAVVELEQIAVARAYRCRGIAGLLINRSFAWVCDEIGRRGASITAVLVTTQANNEARRLYERTLGASIEATLTGLFAADEVVMIARNPRGFSESLERVQAS